MTRSTPRRAVKVHQCDRCQRRILPGERYREAVVSPGHDGLGNVGWWRLAECRDCALRYGRSVDAA